MCSFRELVHSLSLVVYGTQVNNSCDKMLRQCGSSLKLNVWIYSCTSQIVNSLLQKCDKYTHTLSQKMDTRLKRLLSKKNCVLFNVFFLDWNFNLWLRFCWRPFASTLDSESWWWFPVCGPSVCLEPTCVRAGPRWSSGLHIVSLLSWPFGDLWLCTSVLQGRCLTF